MNLKSVNSQGFSHHIVLVAFVLVFAVAGVGFLVASHAQGRLCKNRTFGPGSTGHCVKDIQIAAHLMKDPPARTLKVDGKYGSSTASAVKQLQKYRKLNADGIVGPKTWYSVCWSLKISTGGHPVSAQGKAVQKAAKAAFNDAGCAK